jgi:hypothetical protein
MAVERCEHCGSALPLGRSGPWCSSWCETRQARGLPPQQPPAAVASIAALRGRVSVRDRVAETLEANGVTDEWQAAAALDLAQWIDDGTSKGSALAALHRELRSVMAEVLRGSDDVRSSVGRARNELAERRARRAGGGSV